MPKAKLTQRQDGRFRCWWQGKQFYGKTMREAYAKRDEYKRQIEAGRNPDKITLQAYANYWLPIAKASTQEASYYTYENLLKKLCAALGDCPIGQIKPSDIKAFFTASFAGKATHYIKAAYHLYSSLFSAACDDGYCAKNPCKDKSAMPHKGTCKGHRAITEDERHIIETCALNHPVHPVAMVMLYAGLRTGEAQALDMADVDFEAGTIHVCHAYHATRTDKRIRNDIMKNPGSKRYVPLFSILADCLRGRSGLIITNQDGKELTASDWHKAWHSYKIKIERELNGCTSAIYERRRKKNPSLPPFRAFDVTPYDLRHSFCTWCRDNHIDLHTCAKWMGHANADMILRVYDEVTDNREIAERMRIEEALKNR